MLPSAPPYMPRSISFGGIDILFNNAGICGYGLAHELTEDAWDSMLDINLKGPWLVARRVIPIMIERRRGVIINNSSVAGLRGMARLSHYAASKWGLVGLTRSWAIELAPYNIRVIALCPTGVNTPMNDGLAMLEGATPREIAERSAGNLLPMPWIEPEDVAGRRVLASEVGLRFLDAGLLADKRGTDSPRIVECHPIVDSGIRWQTPAQRFPRAAFRSTAILERMRSR